MAKKQHAFVKVTTPVGRASFPHIFAPKPVKEGDKGEPKFQLSLLFPKTEANVLTPLQLAVKQILDEIFPDVAKRPKLKMPFLDGDADDYRNPETGNPKWDGYAGCWFIRTSSTKRPGVVDANLARILDPNDFYAGCYVRATVNPYYWENSGKQGISFGLLNLQKVRDGEKFGNQTSAEDDFSALPSAAPAAGASKDPNDIM